MSFLKILDYKSKVIACCSIGFLLYFLGAHVLTLHENMEEFKNAKEILTFSLFPISTLIGLSIGLKNAYIGGLLVLFSMLMFFMLSPNNKQEPIFLLGFLLPGLLFLIIGLIKRNRY